MSLSEMIAKAMLAVLLTVSQLHFCDSKFIAPGGLECQECESLTDHSHDAGEQAGPHGDCHDCCELRECDTPSGSDSTASPQPFGFDLAVLPASPAGPEIPEPVLSKQEFQFFFGAPSHGPPAVPSTRGPPFLDLAQLFAGSMIGSCA
jgi:hypothetical protein